MASFFGGCNEVVDFYGTSNSKAAHDPPFRPECPAGGLPAFEKMAFRTDPESQPRRPRKRRPDRRLEEADDDAQARRRLPEVKETYTITLPRLSGARVTNHREGDDLVAGVERWGTDPKCGLVV